MCGIIALSGTKTREIADTTLRSMLATLSRRGPDDSGFERFEEAVIGQTRLSIIDLVTGHQPMKDNARPFTVAFNGEIYGYKKVRAELEHRGYRFSTTSDTEVILKAYAEYGHDCVKHLDGMFAFAIWDDDKKEFFIARDRFGKKPLYYSEKDGVIYFASEIKALIAAGIRGTIDPSALDDYLRFMYIPPHKSIYKNVHVVPPAHALAVRNGSIRMWRYWHLEKKEVRVSYDEAKQEIKRLLNEAVEKRMVADVEIGSLLSGGVDSTLVTFYAQQFSKRQIKTFCIGYDGHKNELPYSAEAARRIGTDHHTLAVSADLVHELSEIIEYMDEPHGDSSNFPQHLISKLAASKVKVVLTGDGADEFFMGYGWYQKWWTTPRWRLDWRLRGIFGAQQKAITIFSPYERHRLLKHQVASDRAFERGLIKNSKNGIDKINAFDIGYYLPGQLLSKIDRTSMMHSLEARSPFLDTKLAEYVYNLPTTFKMQKGANKIILKDILADVFPKEFVYRRKQGFGAPIEHWLMSDALRKLTKELVSEDSRAFDFIHKKEITRIRNDFYAGKRNMAGKLWITTCLLLWFKKHRGDYI